MGGIFDIFLSKLDVNDSLASSNRDFRVGVRELREGGKVLSMEGDCRKKGISLLKMTFPFLIIAELITRTSEVISYTANLFHVPLPSHVVRVEFPKAAIVKGLSKAM